MATIWTDADRQRASAEIIFRKCAADKFFFFENFWKIKHPLGSRLFVPRPPQQDVLTIWGRGDNSITLKARQIGWSTSVASDTFWEAFFHPEYQAMLLSKGEREAVQLLSHAKYGYKQLPQWIRDRGPKLLDDAQQRMTFDSESQILSLPSSNNPARGYTGNRVVADEFAFLSNDVESWAAMEPVADIGGQLILLSTANGFGNLFHEQWTRARIGESSFVPSFYGWWAVPERDQAWYDQKAKDLMPWQMAQEYPSNEEEAFIKSGNMVFDYDIVSKMDPREPTRIGDMVDGRFVDLNGGPFAIWDEPEPLQDYVLGIDTAEGLGYGDYSVCDVLTPEGVQVAQWHGKTDPDLFGRICAWIGTKYNGALAVPEANSIGLATITTMRNQGYGRIWRRQSVNTTSTGFTTQLGFHTSRTSKPELIARLAEGLREGIVIRSARTITELMQYVRDDKGLTNGSPHDDAVMSLALAHYGRPYVHAAEYKKTPEVIEGSWDYHFARLESDKPDGSSRRIGAWNERRSPL